jgi:hypothetical protein
VLSRRVLSRRSCIGVGLAESCKRSGVVKSVPTLYESLVVRSVVKGWRRMC